MDALGLEIDGDYDLSEIESRLYSQVFHGTPEEETNTNICNPCDNISTSVTSHRQRYRYFENRIPLGKRPQVQINIDSSNQAPTNSSTDCNNLTFVTPPDELITFSSGYENILNQYTVPVFISTDNVLNSWNIIHSNCENLENLPSNIEHLETWNSHGQILTRKQRTQLRNKRRKERKKLKQFNKNMVKKANKKIIFISDDSDCDRVLLDENPNIALKDIDSKNVENEICDSDCDDDIIYVPPPPVQIINIDEEDLKEISKPPEKESFIGNENQVLEKKSCLNQILSCTPSPEPSYAAESTSNDFLDNTSTENPSNRFNFELHGSDFSNNGEFAQPNNNSHVDFCETESSCSTTDQNKDFNNSAKSIVFSEIEFPKENIFSDKNLDSFSSFITPKHNDKIVENTTKSPKKKNNNILRDTDSSTSSTESDYESDAQYSNKNLPTLSPMITPQVLSKINSTPKINKKRFRGTSDHSSMCAKTPTKRKSCDSHEIGESITKFKKKKKPNKDSEAKDVLLEHRDIEIQNEEKADNSTKKKKKRRSQNLSDKASEFLNQDMLNSVDESNPSDLNISTGYETTGVQDQGKNKKRKKKKAKTSVNNDEGKPEDSICIAPTDTLPLTDSENTAIQDENLTTSVANREGVDNTENIEIMNENSYERLDPINDPNDINLFDESIQENRDDIIIQQDQGTCDDDVIVIEHNERESVDAEVIVLDDMSDSSDVELIENVSINCIDLSNVNVGNCNTSVETTLDICPNDGSMDDLNSFDLTAIWSKQSDDPNKWLISYKDQNNYIMLGNKGPRCNRCRHFGHIGSKCPEKPNPPSCSLCSATSHEEPRCPNKVCRQCGNPGDYSVSYCYICFKYRHIKCNLCNVPGHIAKNCPDLWRRYHLTTEPGPIIMPNEQVLRPRNQQWCSGCAQQGHLEHECNDAFYHREFPPTRPDIVTYIDVLNENNIPRDTACIPKPTRPNNMPLYSFPIMNNLLTINTNPVSSFGRTVSPNSLNSNIIIQVPNTCVQRNVLPPNLIDQIRSNFENQNVNNLNTNIIQQMSHNFQNPVVPDHKTTSNSTDPSKYDMKKIHELFMKMPHAAVKNFVRNQVRELDTEIIKFNPRVLRHKLFKYDRPEDQNEKIRRDRHYWFRVLNMFIFGIHNLNDGKLHIRFIRNFLATGRANQFDDNSRRSLFNSYAYIFGIDKHRSISYYRLLKLLVDRCKDGKEIKPL